jgi:hypothetical protein
MLPKSIIDNDFSLLPGARTLKTTCVNFALDPLAEGY